MSTQQPLWLSVHTQPLLFVPSLSCQKHHFTGGGKNEKTNGSGQILKERWANRTSKVHLRLISRKGLIDLLVYCSRFSVVLDTKESCHLEWKMRDPTRLPANLFPVPFRRGSMSALLWVSPIVSYICIQK